jgi:hypothetical protein
MLQWDLKLPRKLPKPERRCCPCRSFLDANYRDEPGALSSTSLSCRSFCADFNSLARRRRDSNAPQCSPGSPARTADTSVLARHLCRHLSSMSNDPSYAQRQARYRARQTARYAELEAEVKRLRAELASRDAAGKRARPEPPPPDFSPAQRQAATDRCSCRLRGLGAAGLVGIEKALGPTPPPR